MMGEQFEPHPQGKPLRLDPDAESASPELPAFLARPEDAPAYHGFPLLEETRTPDGWCFGTISDYDCPEGRNWGDAFVVAPDNSRAGIIWQVGELGISEVSAPGSRRWGVYGVGFTKLVHNRRELVEQLQANLQQLQQIYQRWKACQTGMH